MSRVFDRLAVWYDDQPRSGADNMAVDQLLLERSGELPVLRVYHWSEPTVSFGYFVPLADAEMVFSGEDITYLRRWTGGGVVDHRLDVTYTLVIPRKHSLATVRGAESYRMIHAVLAEALQGLGCDVCLTNANMGDGAAACFSNPVAYDLMDASGGKVAGAGQRRTRYGLLHQGSVAANVAAEELLEVLAGQLAMQRVEFTPSVDFLTSVECLAVGRYATEAWLRKR